MQMQYCIATRFSFAVFLTRPRRRGDRVRSSSSGGTDMEPYTHVESVEMWEEILEDAGNALVVVDFWATWWCVRCLRHRACGVRALRATLL
jgi:thiol-disulfide isomerase/thioredoxin